MEPEMKNLFSVLKGHRTIKCDNEFEPEVLNTFSAKRVWLFETLKKMYMYELIRASDTQK